MIRLWKKHNDGDVLQHIPVVVLSDFPLVLRMI